MTLSSSCLQFSRQVGGSCGSAELVLTVSIADRLHEIA